MLGDATVDTVIVADIKSLQTCHAADVSGDAAIQLIIIHIQYSQIDKISKSCR